MAGEMTLYEQDGVFIHTTISSADDDDDDALLSGTVYMTRKPEGVFVEWKQADKKQYDLEKEDVGKEEWAMVNSVSFKSRPTEGDSLDAVKINTPKRHKYIVNFDINDLKSFKRSAPGYGWSYLVFILKDGTTYPALHFHHGGSKALVRQLGKFIHIQQSANDHRLFIVKDHDPGALSKSFDELNLFGESSQDLVSKFFDNPYASTLTGFSKVTNFLKDALLISEAPKERPRDLVAPVFDTEVQGINQQSEAGFEVITKVELPARGEVKRGSPLTLQQWNEFKDDEGRITNVDEIKQIIFRGGLADNILRAEVWKFLLGYYKWDSTSKEREKDRKQRVDDYFRMKLQWKSVTPDQERRFFVMKDRKALIDKDVMRTDRIEAYYQGTSNPHLQVLNDILMTYCMYNFDLGYVQGMSDLLSPILVLMDNEVDAFWCFSGFMDMVEVNFELSQQGMKTQLSQIHTLLRFVDPQLYNYLESHDSSNMFFCFRWLLIIFKREFNFPDIMRLWEVFWTGLPCKNFHLLMCLGILDMQKNVMMENDFHFTEILRHINDLSCQIDVEETLKLGEAIYLQLCEAESVPKDVKLIVGLTLDRDDSTDRSRYTTPAQTPEGAVGGVTDDCLSLPLTEHAGSAASSAANTRATTPDIDSNMEMFEELIGVMT